DSGVRLTSVGRMASCASCAPGLAFAVLGPPRYLAPCLSLIQALTLPSASSETRTESVRMYVIKPVAPSAPSSTPSYSCCAMRMVFRGRKRRRLDASCCRVEVMYGRYEDLVRR